MELDERVARLEVQMETLSAQNSAISIQLREINDKLSRQKGFFGGIIFVISALFAALGLFVDLFKHG